MKILFVENRYATWLYQAVATRLASAGYEIHWLVQNPVFKPDMGRSHVLPFPRGTHDLADDPAYHWVRRTDRSFLHFGMPGLHYRHYDQHIRRILATVAPDIVFGEATQFHELLTIRSCESLGIAYRSPNSTRYPPGRTCFLEADSMQAVGGSGERLTDEQASTLLQAIIDRKLVPSYMVRARPSVFQERTAKAMDTMRILSGYARGERYVTPSPARKALLERRHRAFVAQWEEIATSLLPVDCVRTPWVLYPLQMQPEGNLDVWGQPWNDQADTVERTAKALARIGARLVVKPNPKSKYEISEKLLAVVRSHPNVITLRHATKMADFFPLAPMIMGVTGTVILESIFAQKPVAVLGDNGFSRLPGARAISTPEDIAPELENTLKREHNTASSQAILDLLKTLHATSYPGQMFDPLNQRQYLCDANMDALAVAFMDQTNQSKHSPNQPQS